MKQNLKNRVLAAVLTIVALAVGQRAWAQTFTIEASHNTSTNKTTFTITRTSNTSATETVYYRTVSLSAIAGQHFADKYGELTFDADHNSREVEVTESTPSSDVYKYQTTTSRKYRFEVLDPGGFQLAYTDRSITTGTSVPSSGLFNERTITIYTSEVQYSDAGYDQTNNPHYIESSAYYGLTNIAPKAYYTLIGAELRSTLSFDAKEKNNGYQYVQILINNITDSDNRSKCDDGDPGNISLSRYMAGFDHDPGDKNTNYAAYTFPVLSQPNNCSALTNAWSNGVDNILYTQKFNTNCRATDGRLILPLDFEKLVVRFNASGGGTDHDEWYAKNVKAHIQAVDGTAPTASGAKKVNGGRHSKGNTIYVSVPFSEIVTVSGTPTLTTTWGTLSYTAGSGSNVLTFKGTISDSASGAFTISGYTGTIQDLAGNSLSGTISGTLLAADYLEGSYAYPITYNDLEDGTVEPANPSTYTYNTSTFTLNNPTRTGYTFDGWTGSNGTTAETTVTIANHSTGDKSYTANWTINTYTIRFHSNDGTDATYDQAFTYDAAQNLTANSFTRTGYTFDHWTTNADGSGTTYTEGQEVLNLTATDGEVIDLYAQWTVHTYTVHFDANNGSGTMGDMDFTYDAAQNLTANAFTLLGYKFGGWTTIADGTGDSYTNAQNVINLTAVDGATVTLYAQWVLCDWTVDNEGTESDPYMIYRSEQFDQLATRVNSGNTYSGKFFKLGDNITVSTMVGTSDRNSFRGTFDGDNKTMTLALTATSNNCAPFMYMKDATIRYLNIAGTISTGYQFAASIAAHTTGTTNIQHCTSTVEITSTVGTANSDGTHGGFVAVNDAGTLSFSNCVFAGKLLGANATCNGGFVGWNEKTEVNYTDCLFAPAEVTMGEANSVTFNRNGKNTFTRTYYLTPFGEAQGNQVVSDVTAVSANKVYKTITAVDGNNYIAECDITCVDEFYIYTGSAVNVTPVVKCDNTLTVGTDYTVTIKDSDNNTVAPEDLINKGDYTLIVDGIGSCVGTQTFAFSIVTSVNLNGYDFVLGKDAEGIYYKIETTDDLNRLAAYVNSGNEAYGQRFMQTADIAYTHTTAWNDATSTEDNYTAIGNYSHAFCGIFDGQGHTVSGIRIHQTNTDYLGLFGRVYGESCIVKNVTLTDARIKGKDYIGGISGQTNGTPRPTIQDCLVINTCITATIYCGAIVGRTLFGILNNNYYHNCSLTKDGTTKTTGVGCDGSDLNGARSVHKLTLGSGVTATATVAVTHDNINYYTAGTTVTLSYSGTVPEGCTFSGYTVNGTAITGNTFTMPASDVTISVTIGVSVSYLDADGNTQNTLATPLTGSETSLGSFDETTWYVVSSNISFDHQVAIYGDVRLILSDGKTMTMTETDASGHCIGDWSIDANLTIYGQSGGTGALTMNNANGGTLVVNSLTINGGHITATALNDALGVGQNLTINGGIVSATSTNQYGIYIQSGNVTINGGVVNATSTNQYGISVFDGNVTINGGNVTTIGDNSGIHARSGPITINGGNVTASGNTSNGISTSNFITLGWTHASDRIYASSYSRNPRIKSGQAFSDGTNIYTGTLDKSTIAGKTLMGVDVLQDAADNNIAALNGKQTNVVLRGRTLYKDGSWNTLCLPFNLDVWYDIQNNANSPLHGATIMKFDTERWYNANGENVVNEYAEGCHRSGQIENGNLYLYFVKAMEGNYGYSSNIAAGEPVLVKWDGDGTNNIVNPVFTGVTISKDTYWMNQTTKEGSDNYTHDGNVTFKSTYSPVTFDAADKSVLFMGSNNTLYYPEAGASIGAFRAYFQLNNGLSAGNLPANGVKMFFGNERPTLVSLPSGREAAGAWYDLQGRKLEGKPLPRGIYVNNGRKVVIK